VAPTYITLGLLGSGAATSLRPEKGPDAGAGPMGVQLVLLSVMDGSVRPSKHSSTGRNPRFLRPLARDLESTSVRNQLRNIVHLLFARIETRRVAVVRL